MDPLTTAFPEVPIPVCGEHVRAGDDSGGAASCEPGPCTTVCRMSVSPAAAAAPSTLPPVAADLDDVVVLGVPFWGWQIALAAAGVIVLLLLARTIWSPSPRSLRAWALGNIVVNAGIAVTGAVVRVTSSGLGCSEWPRCTPESFVPTNTGHTAFNAAVEFGNRTLTFLVLVVGVITLLAVLRSVPRRRDLTLMAAIVPGGVLGQGVVGGITVWTDLHPASVATHFLLSMVMVFVTVALYVRLQEPRGKPEVSVTPMLHVTSVALVVIGFLLLIAGTMTTGTGPHGGDASAPRWDLPLENVTRVHSVLAWLCLIGALAATVMAHRTGARRSVRLAATTLLVLTVAQGILGYVQYAFALPEYLVVLHVLGSGLTWIAISRLYFSTTRLVPEGEKLIDDPVARSEEHAPAEPAPER